MLNDSLDDILALHAEWLTSGGTRGRRAQLSGMDLRMHSLAGVDLSHAAMERCNLERADLTEARLAGADLRQARLGYAVARGADLSGADLSKAHAVGVDLSGARLRDGRLDGATFDGAQFVDADLCGVRGRVVRLVRCNLSHARLQRAHLEDVQLADANLAHVDIGEATLWGADLQGASIVGVRFHAAASIEDVRADVALKEPLPHEIVLDRQQMRRLVRLNAKRKSVGEIAQALDVSRAVVKHQLDQIASDRQAREDAAPVVGSLARMARMYRRLGVAAFATAALAIGFVFASGVIDLLRLVQGGSAGTGHEGWYALWLLAALLAGVAGAAAFVARNRVLQSLARTRHELREAHEAREARVAANDTSAAVIGEVPPAEPQQLWGT